MTAIEVHTYRFTCDGCTRPAHSFVITNAPDLAAAVKQIRSMGWFVQEETTPGGWTKYPRTVCPRATHG